VFSQTVFNLENINITSVSSLSSLSLKIFCTNYYDPAKTPLYIPRHSNYLYGGARPGKKHITEEELKYLKEGRDHTNG
jgi:hypothetical protein